MNTVTRKIDNLRRIVLPTDIDGFGWTERTPLDVTVTDDGIVLLRANKPFCRLCGDAATELIEVEKGVICKQCLQTALENNARGERE